jgi:hypothetical protein
MHPLRMSWPALLAPHSTTTYGMPTCACRGRTTIWRLRSLSGGFETLPLVRGRGDAGQPLDGYTRLDTGNILLVLAMLPPSA